MAFTSWEAVRTSLKDALQDHITNGKALVGMVTINGRQLQYNGLQSVMDLLEATYKLESLDTAGSRTTRVSYGRFRRF